MTLPTGTVTFLFTDIQGSTRLLHALGEGYSEVLQLHHQLVRAAVERHGGYEVDTAGDGFFVAFASARNAVAAAADAQRALSTHPLLTAAGLRVRMGLHSGTPMRVASGYVGLDVHRAARICGVGHGGQVLLSESTRVQLHEGPPPGLSLVDLGEHRLRDLTRAERLFQLAPADLPGSFPPLRTLDLRLRNLPVQPTPLIGREREIGEAGGLLREPQVRLLTLTGPGGTGKTRLALQVAAETVEHFSDGVFFVNLAPLAEAALVASAVAQALGVKEAADRPLAAVLAEYLADRQTLLLLDNFEHVADAAPLVGELLAAAAGLKVLATSRVPLHLRGERESAVPPLPLPDPMQLPPLDALRRNEAVRLFTERAQDVKPGFQVDDDNAAAVAEICHRLDGLPLAIELAAARIRILTPQAMLARLRSRLQLLTGGARDLPERQQTLRNAIEWSYDLLGDDEKLLFHRLAVFAGGRTLEAIESVCAADGEVDALDGVASLVDKSLLRQEEVTGGEPRFVMLETIQEFAAEKLEQSGEAEATQRLHLRFFLALAEEAEAELAGSAPGRWLARLAIEHGNFRVALRGSLASGDAESAGRLAAALRGFWFQQGHLREGRQWLAEALASGALSPTTRSRALLAAGGLAIRQHDLPSAGTLLEEGIALARELDDTTRVVDALHNLGVLAWKQGDFARAEALFEECLQRAAEIGQRRPRVLVNLALIAQRRGDLERAESLCEQALALSRELGESESAAVALYNLADAARRQEKFDRARELVRESLRLYAEVGSVPLATFGLSNLALHTSATGGAERAARLFGAVEARFAEMGTHVEAGDRAEFDGFRDSARARVGDAAWEQAYREGATMTLEEAIAYALEEG